MFEVDGKIATIVEMYEKSKDKTEDPNKAFAIIYQIEGDSKFHIMTGVRLEMHTEH